MDVGVGGYLNKYDTPGYNPFNMMRILCVS